MRFHEHLKDTSVFTLTLVTSIITVWVYLIGNIFWLISYLDNVYSKQGDISFWNIPLMLINFVSAAYSILYLSHWFEKLIVSTIPSVWKNEPLIYEYKIRNGIERILHSKHFYFSILGWTCAFAFFFQLPMMLNSEHLAESTYLTKSFLAFPKAFVLAFFLYGVGYIFSVLVFSKIQSSDQTLQLQTEKTKDFISSTLSFAWKTATYNIKKRLFAFLLSTTLTFGILLFLFPHTDILLLLLYSGGVGFMTFGMTYVWSSVRQSSKRANKSVSPTYDEQVKEQNENVTLPTTLSFEGHTFTEETENLLNQINHLLSSIHDYRGFLSKSELHVLYRMFEKELPTFIHHYVSLPTNEKEKHEEFLNTKLNIVLQEASRIYEASYATHVQGFTKVGKLLDMRYDSASEKVKQDNQ